MQIRHERTANLVGAMAQVLNYFRNAKATVSVLLVGNYTNLINVYLTQIDHSATMGVASIEGHCMYNSACDSSFQ